MTWELRAVATLLQNPRLNSQHPHDSPQLSVAPVPRAPMPCSWLRRHCTHPVNIHTSRQNNHTYIYFFFKESSSPITLEILVGKQREERMLYLGELINLIHSVKHLASPFSPSLSYFVLQILRMLHIIQN